MKINILGLIDFKKVDTILEGFNKTTGFVTAILDLDGNVLSKSGWRKICTKYHRVNQISAKKCTISDTELAGRLRDGKKYHYYECLNGLVDVAVPIVINGEHIANLFSGQFFFEKPDIKFFEKQADELNFPKEEYLQALSEVPIISEAKVKTAMQFLLDMTHLISEMTYQKLQEMELNATIKESEERFSKSFKSSPIPITISNINDDKYIEVNKAWSQLYSYTKEEAIGKSPVELLIIDKKSRKKIINELKKNGSIKNKELSLYTKNKDKRIIHLYSENIEINGEPCILSSEIDITKSKEIEELLRENARYLKETQKIAHLGSWRYNLLKNEITWTEELYKMYGFDPSLPPPPFNEHIKLFTTESWKKLSESLENTIETGKSYELELEIIKNNGDLGWIWVRGEAEKDANGKIVNLWGAAQDITERKIIEEAMQKSSKLESIGTLAGGIAHDFNNLLSGIYGNIELAKLKSKDDNVNNYLDKTLNSIERARSLTSQLLTFSKGGSPVKKIINVNSFLKDTINFALSGLSTISKFDIDPNLWNCEIDKNLICQAIDNIVINAQQAMKSGGTVEITAKNIILSNNNELPNGNYISISIKDYGIGIPKESISRIFDPFYTTKFTGHGIGLSTAYSILKRHGGAIEVESEESVGSNFTIYLPAVESEIENEINSSNDNHLGKGIFIIMDDDLVVLDNLASILEYSGYTVILTTKGEEAIKSFEEKQKMGEKIVGMIFDLTIAGGLGGKETVKAIRTLNSEIPIFVASGYAENPVIANPQDHGFTASLVKPYKISEITKLLNKYC